MKVIVTIIPTNFVANSLLSLFCPAIQIKNKNETLTKLVAWYREIFNFFVYSDSRYSDFKAIPNSKDFYNGIFLHAIPVCIILY